ncbi:MAG: helix-turn-helix domain-containing protein [Oscillospiraceae bacterium]|nr:helix-turn-helix domain-containing protein [Oscillospiraceae bacterium]
MTTSLFLLRPITVADLVSDVPWHSNHEKQKSNHRLPECKPCVVYIYEVLRKNGGVHKMSLATNLSTLRKKHGLTQMELAEKLNVSRQAISRWEVGAAVPSTDNLKILSHLYGVSVDDILNGGVASVPQSSDLSDSPQEALNCNRINKKSKVIIACVLILLALLVAVVAGMVKSHESAGSNNLPMENMPAEEDDGISETFSFE